MSGAEKLKATDKMCFYFVFPRMRCSNRLHDDWREFGNNFRLFSRLLSGTIFKAHKLILAACSKNFADLFETPSLATGSVCVILEATSAENMAALLEFMYKGEVHVSQKALESFLKAAESLQVCQEKVSNY